MINTTFVRNGIATIAVLALSAGAAAAQARLTLDRAVLAPAAAQRAGTRTQINVDTARAIVDACVAYAKANNASYSIYVLGPSGEMVQTHVMEGQLPIGVETALMKAQTALYARAPSSEVAARYAQAGVQSYMQRAHLGSDAGLAYYPVAGGLPIVIDGFMIGAIGIGGGYSTVPNGKSPSDEQCAQHALDVVLNGKAPTPMKTTALPPTPVPLARAVVDGAAAQRIATKTQIRPELARAIVDSAVALAKKEGFGGYSIFLLAPTGEVLESYVMDGQTLVNQHTGLMKAKTALYTRAPTREVLERFRDDVIGNMYRLELGQSRGLFYFANLGGLPIIVDGQIIGAIGVGGMPANGPNSSDEELAHHALTQVLGPQPPLPPRQRPAAKPATR
jgi:glc operon protein GlcG